MSWPWLILSEKKVERDRTCRKDVVNPGTLEGFRTRIGGGVLSIRCGWISMARNLPNYMFMWHRELSSFYLSLSLFFFLRSGRTVGTLRRLRECVLLLVSASERGDLLHTSTFLSLVVSAFRGCTRVGFIPLCTINLYIYSYHYPLSFSSHWVVTSIESDDTSWSRLAARCMMMADRKFPRINLTFYNNHHLGGQPVGNKISCVLEGLSIFL